MTTLKKDVIPRGHWRGIHGPPTTTFGGDDLLKALAALIAVLPLTGCMLATQQDLLKIDQNMTQMRRQQADLGVKMTELSGNLQALNSQLESNQQRMSTLSQKLEDLQADLTRRLSVISGQVGGGPASGSGGSTSSASPSELFRLAHLDFQSGKYELALVGFRNIVSQHAKSEVAPQAQFYIGETEFARKNFMDAAQAYEVTSSLYKKTDYAPRAQFKRAVALQSAGKNADSKEALRQFLKDYPRHELAKSAKDLLNP